MSAPKRTGLGRGIGALIPMNEHTVDTFFTPGIGGTATAIAPDDLVAVPGARLAALDPNEIRPNPQQPRTDFDAEAMEELVHSIRENGVLQPIVVRPLPPGENARYELVMGERRLRATKEAGLRTIPAVVKDTADEQMLHEALLENLHRSQLNPLEEASAYQQLIADFGITHEQLGARLGRSRPMITNTVRLLRLPEHIQRKVAAGVLSAGHARAVLSVVDPELMDHLVDGPPQRAPRRDRGPARQPLRHPGAGEPQRQARADRHRLRVRGRPQPHPRRHRRAGVGRGRGPRADARPAPRLTASR